MWRFLPQVCDDPLDRKRGLHVLRTVKPAATAPLLAPLLQLYEALDDFALYAVQVS